MERMQKMRVRMGNRTLTTKLPKLLIHKPTTNSSTNKKETTAVHEQNKRAIHRTPTKIPRKKKNGGNKMSQDMRVLARQIVGLVQHLTNIGDTRTAIDVVESILTSNKSTKPETKPKVTAQKWKKWTPEEDAYLLEKRRQGMTYKEISRHLGRKKAAARSRMELLRDRHDARTDGQKEFPKIKTRQEEKPLDTSNVQRAGVPWSSDEDQFLHTNQHSVSPEELAKQLRREPEEVRQRLKMINA